MKHILILFCLVLVAQTPGLAQLGLSYATRPDEYTIALWGKFSGYRSKDSLRIKKIEFVQGDVEAVSVGVLRSDPYNDGKPTGSILPLITLPLELVTMSVMGFGEHGEKHPGLIPDSTLAGKLITGVMLTTYLLNSQIHFSVVHPDTGFDGPNFTLFIGFQSDLFAVNYTRFQVAPEVGIELQYIFDRPGFAFGKSLGVQFGYDRPWQTGSGFCDARLFGAVRWGFVL